MEAAGPAEINQKLHASSSHETTTTAVPIHIDDSVFKGKLPLFIRSLCTQYPAPGPFTVENLEWKLVGTGTQMGLAAAFPQNRLADFRSGESQRGRCRVDISNVMPPTEGVPMSVRGVCVFAAPHSAVEKRRQAEPATAPPLPRKEGVKARYGKHQTGTSCKKNCAYYFFAKAYAKCPGVVIIKFPCCEGDTLATCASMKHCTPAGDPAHTDVDAQIFLRQWSEKATDLIIEQLKLQRKPSLIVQEVKLSVLKWLDIPEDTDPEEIEERVAASQYSKDYYVTPARIRYLRQQYVDVKWMHARPDPAATAAASAGAVAPARAVGRPRAVFPKADAAAPGSSAAPAVTSLALQPIAPVGKAITAVAAPAPAAGVAAGSANASANSTVAANAVAGAAAVASANPAGAATPATPALCSQRQCDEASISAMAEPAARDSASFHAVAQAQEEVELLVKLAFWQIHRSPPQVQQVQMEKMRNAAMTALWEVMSPRTETHGHDETALESVREASTAGIACNADALEAISRLNSTQHKQAQVPADSSAPAQRASVWQRPREDGPSKPRCDDSSSYQPLPHEMHPELTSGQAQEAAQAIDRCLTQLSTQEPSRRDSDAILAPEHKRVKVDPSLPLERCVVPVEVAEPAQPVQAQHNLQQMLPALLQQQIQWQEERDEAQRREQEVQQRCLHLLEQIGQQREAPHSQNQHDVLRLIALGLHGSVSHD